MKKLMFSPNEQSKHYQFHININMKYYIARKMSKCIL